MPGVRGSDLHDLSHQVVRDMAIRAAETPDEVRGVRSVPQGQRGHLQARGPALSPFPEQGDVLEP